MWLWGYIAVEIPQERFSLTTDIMNTTASSVVHISNIHTNLTTPSPYSFVDIYSVPLFRKFVLFRSVFFPIGILLGLFGNAMTIVIIHRLKTSRSAMDRYFLSLAVTDLCVIIAQVIPIWIQTFTGFRLLGTHDAVCKIFASVYNAALASSSWILATMATHRALMVTWPHRINAICTPRRSWSAVIVIVIISCLAHSHILYGAYVIFPGRVCGFTGAYHLVDVWLKIEPYLHSILPILCIIPSNIAMVLKLRVSVREAGEQLATGDKQLTSRSKAVSSITIQAVVVSAVFVVLTMPVTVWNATNYIWKDRPVTDLHLLSVRMVLQSSFYLLSIAIIMWTSTCTVWQGVNSETSSSLYFAIFKGAGITFLQASRTRSLHSVPTPAVRAVPQCLHHLVCEKPDIKYIHKYSTQTHTIHLNHWITVTEFIQKRDKINFSEWFEILVFVFTPVPRNKT